MSFLNVQGRGEHSLEGSCDEDSKVMEMSIHWSNGSKVNNAQSQRAGSPLYSTFTHPPVSNWRYHLPPFPTIKSFFGASTGLYG